MSNENVNFAANPAIQSDYPYTDLAQQQYLQQFLIQPQQYQSLQPTQQQLLFQQLQQQQQHLLSLQQHNSDHTDSHSFPDKFNKYSSYNFQSKIKNESTDQRFAPYPIHPDVSSTNLLTLDPPANTQAYHNSFFNSSNNNFNQRNPYDRVYGSNLYNFNNHNINNLDATLNNDVNYNSFYHSTPKRQLSQQPQQQTVNNYYTYNNILFCIPPTFPQNQLSQSFSPISNYNDGDDQENFTKIQLQPSKNQLSIQQHQWQQSQQHHPSHQQTQNSQALDPSIHEGDGQARENGLPEYVDDLNIDQNPDSKFQQHTQLSCNILQHQLEQQQQQQEKKYFTSHSVSNNPQELQQKTEQYETIYNPPQHQCNPQQHLRHGPQQLHQQQQPQNSSETSNHKTQNLNASTVSFQSSDINVSELEKFAKYLKQSRIRLGYTQADVGKTLGEMYGNEFSQTTVCRFEALQLSVRNMVRLKPLMLKWLQEVEKQKNDLKNESDDEENNGEKSNFQSSSNMENNTTFSPSQTSNNFSSGYMSGSALSDAVNATLPVSVLSSFYGKPRRKRTSIDELSRKILETEFARKNKPNAKDFSRISETLGFEKETIRIWFCNRRQKQKKAVLGISNNSSYNTVAFLMQSQQQPENNASATHDDNYPASHYYNQFSYSNSKSYRS